LSEAANPLLNMGVGREGEPLDFEILHFSTIFSKKGRFLSFEKEK